MKILAIYLFNRQLLRQISTVIHVIYTFNVLCPLAASCHFLSILICVVIIFETSTSFSS